jgi:hypothetical protein
VLYALLCLIVPAVWGFFSYWLFSKIDAARSRKAKQNQDDQSPPIDYEI